MKAYQMKFALVASLALGVSATTMAKTSGGYLWAQGGKTVRITAGDGIPDPIHVFPRHVQGENYTFAITDSDSNVLVYSKDNTFDLEGAGEGTCRIYGIAYDGEFSMPTGVSVHSLSASGSLSVSRNRISVVRTAAKLIDGGWIISDGRGRATVKVNLNNPQPVRAYSANKAATDSSYSYVITDNEGMVLGYPPANQFDFSGAPPGTCRIYGISYTGTLETTPGISIYEVMSDEDNQMLSKNYIPVTRYEK